MRVRLPDRASVVIVGGGVAGASTAYFLARGGARDLVVLEKEAICGHHASGRNAALGRQICENHAFTELAVRGARFLRQPPDGFADRPLLSRSGSLLLASDDRTLAGITRRAAEYDVPCAPTPVAAALERFPLLDGTPMVGAVWFPTDGVIDVQALLQAFLRGARDGGALVATGCELVGVETAGSSVRVHTTRGAIDARCVVVAAGAWAGPVGALGGARATRFDPIRRHLFVTEAVPGFDRGAPFAWHLDDEFYARPESGALLVSGCDGAIVPPDDARPDTDAISALARKLTRLAPRIADLGVVRAWACLRTFAADGGGPRIAWDADVPSLFWVAGLGGHGVTASPAIGALAAQRITERLGG